MKKLLFLMMLVLFTGLGCGYKSEVKIDREFSGEEVQQKVIDVRLKTNEGVEMSTEIISGLVKKIENAIKEQTWVITKGADLVIQVNITKYQEGNAFGRFWIGNTFGGGAAATIHGKITFIHKKGTVMEADVMVDTGHDLTSAFRDIKGVQDQFAREIVNLLGQIKK